MIELKNIKKTYKIAKRESGLSNAVKALFKREYTKINALDDISFNIKEGEMVGYIGPNGAGKSSTIKVISGILTPDSGQCIINGLTPWKDRKEHVENIGVVFGQRSQLWWDVPINDSFELLKDIYSIDNKTYKKNLDELVSLLNIEEVIKTPARMLSLGQRMRCEIAASLIHDPKILLLDEPTIGLDAVSKIAVREFIKKINKEKKTTVILTTHDMQDIEALTERILLIGNGKILLDGSLNELKKKKSPIKKVVLDFKDGQISEIKCIEGLSLVSNINGHAEISVNTDILAVSDMIKLISSKLNLTDISVAGTSAEELVVSLYKEFQI